MDRVSLDKIEKDFERRCQLFLRSSSKNEEEDWDSLESLAKDFLARTTTSQYKSFKGFFYYGIALYK